MNKVKVVSFYTANSYYETIYKKLENSCEKFNIPCFIEKRNCRGSWVKNCAQKPEFILEQMNLAEENECLIWLDSDSEIVQTPNLFFEIKESFGIRAEPGSSRKKPAGRETISLPPKWPSSITPRWFNSGTIFFRNEQAIKNMLQCWIDLHKENNKWDQWTLQEAWCEFFPSTSWLPRAYCQIKKLHGNNGAVILHGLASVEQKVQRT